MKAERVKTEEVRVSGDALVVRTKELLHEGNIRRLTIKNEEGQTLIEIPLTLGVIGVALAPSLAAVAAIAALVSNLIIVVEKVEEKAEEKEGEAEDRTGADT